MKTDKKIEDKTNIEEIINKREKFRRIEDWLTL